MVPIPPLPRQTRYILSRQYDNAWVPQMRVPASKASAANKVGTGGGGGGGGGASGGGGGGGGAAGNGQTYFFNIHTGEERATNPNMDFVVANRRSERARVVAVVRARTQPLIAYREQLLKAWIVRAVDGGG